MKNKTSIQTKGGLLQKPNNNNSSQANTIVDNNNYQKYIEIIETKQPEQRSKIISKESKETENVPNEISHFESKYISPNLIKFINSLPKDINDPNYKKKLITQDKAIDMLKEILDNYKIFESPDKTKLMFN